MPAPKPRICPVCKCLVKINIWKHFWNEHPNAMTDGEFLAKLLGYPEPQKCANPNCNNVGIDYGHLTFKTFCCRSCKFQTQNNLLDWMNKHREQHDAQFAKASSEFKKNHPEFAGYGFRHWRETKPEEAAETFRRNFQSIVKWQKENPEEAARQRSQNGTTTGLNWLAKNNSSSKIESDLYSYFIRLFPTEKITHHLVIFGYEADIVFEDRKLIIEVDGAYWHDIEHDYKRDKIIARAGYKIRRLDTVYLLNCVSDFDLIRLIQIESEIPFPYWERIPPDEIMSWKCNIYKIHSDSLKLLTYEVKNAK